jgi:hypothetical protein
MEDHLNFAKKLIFSNLYIFRALYLLVGNRIHHMYNLTRLGYSCLLAIAFLTLFLAPTAFLGTYTSRSILYLLLVSHCCLYVPLLTLVTMHVCHAPSLYLFVNFLFT